MRNSCSSFALELSKEADRSDEEENAYAPNGHSTRRALLLIQFFDEINGACSIIVIVNHWREFVALHQRKCPSFNIETKLTATMNVDSLTKIIQRNGRYLVISAVTLTMKLIRRFSLFSIDLPRWIGG